MGLVDFVNKQFFDREERMKRHKAEAERMRAELDYIKAKKEFLSEKEQILKEGRIPSGACCMARRKIKDEGFAFCFSADFISHASILCHRLYTNKQDRMHEWHLQCNHVFWHKICSGRRYMGIG
jgi:hypothetical protein